MWSIFTAHSKDVWVSVCTTFMSSNRGQSMLGLYPLLLAVPNHWPLVKPMVAWEYVPPQIVIGQYHGDDNDNGSVCGHR